MTTRAVHAEVPSRIDYELTVKDFGDVLLNTYFRSTLRRIERLTFVPCVWPGSMC